MNNSHYLGNNTALCMSRFGQKMFVNTQDNSLTPHFLVEGDWERNITDAISRYCKGATFIDVGANMGWYSLVAEAYGAADVVLFEPNEELFNLVRRTMWVNGFDWKMIQLGLSNEERNVDLHVNPNLMGGASIFPGDIEAVVQSIGIVRFDDFVARHSKLRERLERGREFVFKFDVEGCEAQAVLGAKEFIKSHKCTLFVEHHADPKNERGVSDMLDFLVGESYQIGHIQGNGDIKPIPRHAIENVPDVDMLCFQTFPK